MLSENQQLLSKIRNYRVMIQKSILDSLAPDASSPSNLQAYIDNMFDSGIQNHFLVLLFHTRSGISDSDIRASLSDILPANAAALLLEQTDQQIAYLINFTGPAQPNLKEIAKLLQPLHCSLSFSDISSNPLDISRLYNNAYVAFQYSSSKVVFYDQSPSQGGLGSEALDYPYQLFDSLAEDLRLFRYDESMQKVNALFRSLNRRNHPDFFIRCILIDTVTLIVGAINAANIDFQKYSELYYNLLYLCRNTDYAVSQKEIREKIKQMISILASELSETDLNTSQIQKFVEENCLSSNFSVSMAADHFGITTAYMSYFFKKKFHTNFSDYVWDIRLQHAKQMLEQTELPIENISVKIGYDNPSSFRRKFKETLGMSPSQYRSNVKRL